MRAETPYAFARNSGMRKRIQRKILIELAQQQKEPRAITFADENARITKHDRENLRRLIEETSHMENYNQQRNYDQFEGE